MTLNRSYSFVLISAFALAACGVRPSSEPPLPVSAPTMVVRAEALPQTRSVAGTVRAVNVSTLSATSVGNVTRVLVREGDRVRAGQLLVEIDSRAARAQLDRAYAGRESIERAIDAATASVAAAQTNADLAATNLRRFTALLERGSISRSEYDQAKANADVAAAEVERARRGREQLIAQRAEAGAAGTVASVHVDDASIRSPFDAIVTARFVDPGAQAAPGVPLLAIESAGRFRVETAAPEDLLVRAGDEALVEIGKRTIRARVARVVPALDASIRSATVHIDLPDDPSLRSGAFARVSFTTGQRRGISIPATAMRRQGGVVSVFVVDAKGIARLRLVTTGEESPAAVEILTGLDEGERIVAAIPAALRDGAPLS